MAVKDQDYKVGAGFSPKAYRDSQNTPWEYETPKLIPEKDPSGLSAKEPGSKLDDGKILADDILRMFSRALWAICEVGTFGANKYTLGGWQKVADGVRRYGNAQMRHKLKEWMGEQLDSDSELLHAKHEAWNSLARLELLLRDLEK